MFNISFWELSLVALIALLVLGPERLPAALRGVARTCLLYTSPSPRD